ncbi:MAG: NAD-dependent deacylase [Planctomycetes bacterium]|nr:NAD-dependent deacylase [Planctomycetota bacterium]
MLTDPAAIIERVSERLSAFHSVCCLTGAGVSAESGVPTFRGQGGLWQGRRAEDLATPQAFQRDPEGVWEFYNHRREKLLDCKPNAGHTAIAALEAVFDDWTLITQNVDGLHRQAGSKNIVELHGNIWTTRCTVCRQEIDHFGDKLSRRPACDDCGGLLRPGVVWFGEMLPPDALKAAQEAVGRCQAMLVVGTSSVVEPAASMAGWARAHGALVVEINLERTPLSEQADECLYGKAGEILPRLVSALMARKSDSLQ